jgi:hypothetical protein
VKPAAAATSSGLGDGPNVPQIDSQFKLDVCSLFTQTMRKPVPNAPANLNQAFDQFSLGVQDPSNPGKVELQSRPDLIAYRSKTDPTQVYVTGDPSYKDAQGKPSAYVGKWFQMTQVPSSGGSHMI